MSLLFRFRPLLASGWSSLTYLNIVSHDFPWKEKGFSIADTYNVFLLHSIIIHCGIEICDTPYATCPPGLIIMYLPFLQSTDIFDGEPQLLKNQAYVLYNIILNPQPLPSLHFSRAITGYIKFNDDGRVRNADNASLMLYAAFP